MMLRDDIFIRPHFPCEQRRFIRHHALPRSLLARLTINIYITQDAKNAHLAQGKAG